MRSIVEKPWKIGDIKKKDLKIILQGSKVYLKKDLPHGPYPESRFSELLVLLALLA